jgi:hypothetical protein
MGDLGEFDQGRLQQARQLAAVTRDQLPVFVQQHRLRRAELVDDPTELLDLGGGVGAGVVGSLAPGGWITDAEFCADHALPPDHPEDGRSTAERRDDAQPVRHDGKAKRPPTCASRVRRRIRQRQFLRPFHRPVFVPYTVAKLIMLKPLTAYQRVDISSSVGNDGQTEEST